MKIKKCLRCGFWFNPQTQTWYKTEDPDRRLIESFNHHVFMRANFGPIEFVDALCTECQSLVGTDVEKFKENIRRN